MRVVGIVLVLVGAVVLGVHGFSYLGVDPDGPTARAEGKAGWASPVVAGIAVVGGLLLLAGDGRRDEAA